MGNTNTSRRTVLIVDDDEDLLILIQHALSLEGFDPICSPNGENLKAIVERKRPAIVLLDIRMNGTDGIAICKELKRNPETSSIPVLMLSANSNIKDISLECGADGFITKPFKTDDFRETLRRVLAKQQTINPTL